MTDNEIIKALECCIKGNHCRSDCHYDSEDDSCIECTSKLAKASLDLINRQQAEIERLKSDNDILSKNLHNLCKELEAEKIRNF